MTTTQPDKSFDRSIDYDLDEIFSKADEEAVQALVEPKPTTTGEPQSVSKKVCTNGDGTRALDRLALFTPVEAPKRTHRHRITSSLRASVVGTSSMVALVCLVVGAVVVLSAKTTPPPVTPHQPQAILASAVVDAQSGNHSSYYQPTSISLANSQNPGSFIFSGRDAPDGFIYTKAGKYYLFTSQGEHISMNIPVAVGTKVGKWGPSFDALPKLPKWALKGFTWAPDVRRFGNHYMLYFSADIKGSKPAKECIGDAIATSLTGPYRAVTKPFICQLSQWGSIDPRTFQTPNGQVYMIWKSDENANVKGKANTNIYSQPLSANGETLLGKEARIFGPDEPWQGRIVEAPQLIYVQGNYWLFYSGGWFNQPGYSIGFAKCTGPLGPCRDIGDDRLLGSNTQGAGPGEQSLFLNKTGVYMLYAPWKSNDPTPTPNRPVAMVRVGFSALAPYLATSSSPVGTGGP